MDKIICIKEWLFHEDGIVIDCSFILGKIYYTDKYENIYLINDKSSTYLDFETEFEEDFGEYFMYLSEYRENKLKLILNG